MKQDDVENPRVLPLTVVIIEIQLKRHIAKYKLKIDLVLPSVYSYLLV